MKKRPKFLQNLFKSHFTDYRKRHRQPLKNIKAAEAIMNCRQVEKGSTTYHCPQGHEPIEIPHSCKHRSCPVCASSSINDWVDKQKERLLPCAHYHLVFTLPHDYLDLWLYNRQWFIQTQFEVCREVLMELLGDKKYLGAKPGIMMALHTWGRQLNLHPHIHVLVSGGGLNSSGQWVNVENDFILPVRVVKALYRGKFQHRLKQALKEKTLSLPPNECEQTLQWRIKRVYKKEWSVRIQEKYAHGKGVLLYLSRYIKGGPIKPEQIQALDERQITFSYLDHRAKRNKRLNLSLDEFMRRILMHVPEPRIHTLRHYGLYASQAEVARKRCRTQLADGQSEPLDAPGSAGKRSLFEVFCTDCGAPMIAGLMRRRNTVNENSYIKGSTRSNKHRPLQQVVKADAGRSSSPLERHFDQEFVGDLFCGEGAA
jgi:hypothetical protein